MVAKAETKPATTEPQKPVDIDTSGWTDANVNIDGWYAPEISKIIIGRCLEAIRINTAFGEQDVVKVRLAQDAVGIVGAGDDSENLPLSKGQVIAVRVSSNLTMLLELVQNQCKVKITPTGKKKTKSGRQVYTYKVQFQGQRAPLAQQPAQAQETATSTHSNADPTNFDDAF